MASRAIKTEPMDAKSVHHICRLCMSEDSLDSVFSEDGLYRWISDYLSITISPADNMSQVICSLCRIRLAEFHQFRLHSLEVQEMLQSMIRLCTEGVDAEQPIRIEDMIDLGEVKIESRNDEDYSAEKEELLKTKNAIFMPTKSSQVEEVNDNDFKQTPIKNPKQHDDVGQLIKSFSEKDEYPCSKCNRTFSRKCGLTIHMRVHDKLVEEEHSSETDYKESKPLKDVESDRGIQTSTLDEPVQSEPNSNVNEQYQCDICKKEFLKKRQLSRHMHIHLNNITCPICDKPFTYKVLMRRHMRLHLSNDERIKEIQEEIRPYKCEECEKAFRAKDALKCHKRQVHGFKKHQCHLCDYKSAMR